MLCRWRISVRVFITPNHGRNQKVASKTAKILQNEKAGSFYHAHSPIRLASVMYRLCHLRVLFLSGKSERDLSCFHGSKLVFVSLLPSVPLTRLERTRLIIYRPMERCGRTQYGGLTEERARENGRLAEWIL